MAAKKGFEVALIVFLSIFSWWLMWKSFSYDAKTSEFVIARNEVGDFGLRLALIRSFSWGNNFPVESPFYPGPLLPYHYATDALAGLLERSGIRIDIAINGVSVVFFVALLYLIYTFPQLFFKSTPIVGLGAIALFLLSSNLSFVNFFQAEPLRFSLIEKIWRLPDYLYKGPFDGSVISIFSSLNPYLNQRHLIVGMAIGFAIIFYAVRKLLRNEEISETKVVLMGIFLGLGTRVHILIAFGAGIVLSLLFLLFRKAGRVVPLAAFSFVFALPHISEILRLPSVNRAFFRPGFLTPPPLTLWNFLRFWWLNAGFALIFIPLGVAYSDASRRKVFFAILPLFILPNLFQFSFRMEHNYALFELFFVLSIPFLLRGLTSLWEKKLIGKALAIISFMGLTFSGILNLMVIKNDFRYRVADAPRNPFIQWIKESTLPNAVFLSPQNLYDPVILAGRRSYFGATYYLEVMGYDIVSRRARAKDFFEASSLATLEQMRGSGIQYIAIPNTPIPDFPYAVNEPFLTRSLPAVYKDRSITVFRL